MLAAKDLGHKGERAMTMFKPLSEIALFICVTFAALTASQDAVSSWPEPGEPGSERIPHQFEESGVTITLTVSEVVADRTGRLTRFVTFSEVGTFDDADDIVSANVSNVRLDRAHAVGGGSDSWNVQVEPVEGLTWAGVHDLDDVLVTARFD